MSSYSGDFRAGQTVRCRFNTVNASDVPTTLSSGAVTVSKDGADVTPSGGVTLSVDAGAVTGRHTVVIDMSVDATTFTVGSEYSVRLSGTSNVGGTSVVGVVVGEWSVRNRGDSAMLAALGTDNRPKVSADAHTGGVTVAGVTGLLALDSGAVAAGTSTTVFTSTSGTLHATASGAYNNQVLIFTSGANQGERRTISTHTLATGTHTFTLSAALTATPSASDTFVIA